MNRLPFLAQSLLNVPLAIHPRKAEIVIAALAERFGIASLTRVSGEAVALQPRAFYDGDEDFVGHGYVPDPGYDLVAGLAVIPVCGTLVQKLGGVRPWSGMSGYDSIQRAFLGAMEDSDAKAIVLRIDSPGGACAACFDLADEIYNARGVKPIWAVCDEIAYSAAYAIASAADRITVPRTGGTGSIGIICAHYDVSKALTGAGIEVTFISYGARKTDFAPELPLAAEALARAQTEVNILGDLFVDTVARNRGMTAEAVKATEAGTFLGQAGVDIGLADAVMAPDAALRALLATLS